MNDPSSFNANWQPYFDYLADGGDNSPSNIAIAASDGQAPFYISVENVDGLDSTDISYESDPIPYAIGEVQGDVFRRGKTITLTGTIKGLNLAALEIGSQYLQGIFWGTTSGQVLGWTDLPTGIPVYIFCTVNQDLSVARLKNQDYNYTWSWTVGLRASDPRVYNGNDDTIFFWWQQPV